MILGFTKVVESTGIEVGDVVITRCGIPFLIVQDYDGCDFRAVDLLHNIATDYSSTIDAVIEDIEDENSEVERIIKAKNLKIMEV